MNSLRNHSAAVALTVIALLVHLSWWRNLVLGSRRAGGEKPIGGIRWDKLGSWQPRLGLGLAMGIVCIALLMESGRIHRYFPPDLYMALHGVGLGLALASIAVFGAERADAVLMWLVHRRDQESPPNQEEHQTPPVSRRRVLQAVRGAVYAAPAVALGYGTFIEREQFQVDEVTIPIPGLAKELDGLRIVQITDIHMGSFLGSSEMERIVAMANETKAHLAVMTGDLVTRRGDPVDECLLQLSRVKTDAGMIGCLGNHEIYADAQEYVENRGARLGISFLRGEQKLMEFRGKKINFVGVDYQRLHSAYLTGTERLVEPGMPNILLSHNPDVFPVAVSKGFDLTLSGHTHGGQIRVEYLQQFVNPARFITRYIAGLYTQDEKKVYVSRGLGTVAVPTRLGAPPELTVIRLAAV